MERKTNFLFVSEAFADEVKSSAASAPVLSLNKAALLVPKTIVGAYERQIVADVLAGCALVLKLDDSTAPKNAALSSPVKKIFDYAAFQAGIKSFTVPEQDCKGYGLKSRFVQIKSSGDYEQTLQALKRVSEKIWRNSGFMQNFLLIETDDGVIVQSEFNPYHIFYSQIEENLQNWNKVMKQVLSAFGSEMKINDCRWFQYRF